MGLPSITMSYLPYFFDKQCENPETQEIFVDAHFCMEITQKNNAVHAQENQIRNLKEL